MTASERRNPSVLPAMPPNHWAVLGPVKPRLAVEKEQPSMTRTDPVTETGRATPPTVTVRVSAKVSVIGAGIAPVNGCVWALHRLYALAEEASRMSESMVGILRLFPIVDGGDCPQPITLRDHTTTLPHND